jgi:hypothetical protein
MTLTPCPVFIGGEWSKLSDLPATPVHNPSTGELIAEARGHGCVPRMVGNTCD